MPNQTCAHELQGLIQKTRDSTAEAREAIHIVDQLLKHESYLCEEDLSAVYNALKTCVDNWSGLSHLPDFKGHEHNLLAYESWCSELAQAEDLDLLRDTVTTFFRIVSSSEKYYPILEEAKKELQACCRLDISEIKSALQPYEITIRAVQGKEISDEDDDMLMENGNAVHQVYFKRLKMSIDSDKDIINYMDGSCPLLTSAATVNKRTEEKKIKPLWNMFNGYISSEPIYIEYNPEVEKPFQSKEFASRVKSHPYQVAMLEKINGNVVWPIDVPDSWNDRLDDITYFLNHGYIVKVGYEKDHPLFYMLSNKGKSAVQYFLEKINKQPKLMLTQGNYPDVNQLTVLELKRLFTILNQVMTDKPAQCSFLRTTRDWYRIPYACACQESTGRDYILTAGYYTIGNEIADIKEINKLCQSNQSMQLRIIVECESDSQCILENIATNQEISHRITFIDAN